MMTQLELIKSTTSIAHNVNMTWHYGVAEFYYIDDEQEACIDRAEIIEVFETNYPDGRVEKSWTGTTVMSDDAASMHEVLARITKDVNATGNKATVHVRLDYDTWREIEWHWASDPEQGYAWGMAGHEL